MKNKQAIFLAIVATIFSLCIKSTNADHCPEDSKSDPNDTAPNHGGKRRGNGNGCTNTNPHAPSRCDDPNKEYIKCGCACPATCDNWWQDQDCETCHSGCFCRDDLVLDNNDKCVRVEDCPTPVCRDPSREFTEYGSVCPPACPGVNDDKECTLQFVTGCFCKDDLLEDGNGNCVDPLSCPIPVCTDPNREYDECGTACPPSCKNRKEYPVICTTQCVSGCFCKDGLYEDGNGNCVKPQCCTEPECHDHFREYQECGTACPATCANLNETIICDMPCVSGCFCKNGYVEDSNGRCINQWDCPWPTCSDPTRYYTSCGTACPRTCDNKDVAIICNDDCITGCVCNYDLVEDAHGNCIPPEKCPDCQDPEREYTLCGTACPRTCENFYKYDEIICTEQCVEGCVCKDDLVEDGNGNCVQTWECPIPVCDDPNREYQDCGTACPDSCDNANDPYTYCTDQCVSDCFCKAGLIEDGNGTCIPRDQCPGQLCDDPARYFTDCGTACPLTCTNRCKDFGCIQQCVEGCYCKNGKIDDGNGTCVDPADCPRDACQCDDNAVWKKCGTCDGTCADPTPFCTTECREGCFCPRGYVRNQLNICIPRRQCSSSSD